MRRQKLNQMVHEFRFLSEILREQHLEVDDVGHIAVRRGDENLLEATPCRWSHDLGSFGHEEGYRLFWIVDSSLATSLDSSWHRSVIPHGAIANEIAGTIGAQLAQLDQDVEFIVEVSHHRDDFGESKPSITIYKMRDFDWRPSARRLERV